MLVKAVFRLKCFRPKIKDCPPCLGLQFTLKQLKRIGKTETIESIDQSGDLKNGETENAHFSCVNTEKNVASRTTHSHVILVGQNVGQVCNFSTSVHCEFTCCLPA